MSQMHNLLDRLNKLDSKKIAEKAKQKEGLTTDEVIKLKNKFFIDILEKVSKWVPYFILILVIVFVLLFLICCVEYVYLIWGNEEKIFNLIKETMLSFLVMIVSYGVGKFKN